MTDRETLTDAELLILLAIARLDDEAYGVTIREEIERRTGASPSVAATYAALDRLESRGLAVFRLSDPTPERGGRRKKLFHLTGRGAEAVRAARDALARMWAGVDLSDRRSA